MSTQTTTQTTAQTTTARISYVLAGKNANQAAAKAEAAAKTLKGTAQTKLLVAVSFFNSVMNAKTANIAAKDAEAAAQLATKAGNATAAAAAHELALAAVTLAGVFRYMDTTAKAWADMRGDITDVTFERHTTAKKATMRLVVKNTTSRGPVYLTVNTTAAIDWRKIDANYTKRLDKQAAKAAKATKSAK